MYVCILVYVLRRPEPEFVQLNEKAQGNCYLYEICADNNDSLFQNFTKFSLTKICYRSMHMCGGYILVHFIWQINEWRGYDKIYWVWNFTLVDVFPYVSVFVFLPFSPEDHLESYTRPNRRQITFSADNKVSQPILTHTITLVVCI